MKYPIDVFRPVLVITINVQILGGWVFRVDVTWAVSVTKRTGLATYLKYAYRLDEDSAVRMAKYSSRLNGAIIA